MRCGDGQELRGLPAFFLHHGTLGAVQERRVPELGRLVFKPLDLGVLSMRPSSGTKSSSPPRIVVAAFRGRALGFEDVYRLDPDQRPDGGGGRRTVGLPVLPGGPISRQMVDHDTVDDGRLANRNSTVVLFPMAGSSRTTPPGSNPQ